MLEQRKTELLWIEWQKHKTRQITKVLPDDNSELEPPDPIPNSVVKRFSANGSVGYPHVRVGHRQASKYETPLGQPNGVFYCLKESYPLNAPH